MRTGSDLLGRPKNARKGANILSVITFWYALKTFKLGRKRDLDENDLTEPLDEHKSSLLGQKLAKNWSLELINAAKKKREPSLTKAIIKTFKRDIIFYGIVLFIMEFFIRLPQPIFIGLFIRYFNANNIKSTEEQHPPIYIMRVFYYFKKDQSRISKEEAFFFATCIMICSIIVIGTVHPYIMAAMHVGMRVRVACCSLIYRKALRIQITALGDETVGNTVNLMSNDVNRFDLAPVFLHYLWVAPLQGVLITIFLYFEVGYASFFGMLSVLVIMPVQMVLAYATARFRVVVAARTDARVRCMNEIIQAIQVIKIYAWEHAFADMIRKLRKHELKILLLTSYIRGFTMSFLMFTARLGIFLTVLSYVLLGNDINAEKVFLIGGYYIIVRQTLSVFFPHGLNAVAETKVSIARIQKFLMTEEATVGDKSILDPFAVPKTPEETPFLNEKGDLTTRDNISVTDSVDFGTNESSEGRFLPSSYSFAKNPTLFRLLGLGGYLDPEIASVVIFRGLAKYGEDVCLDNINTQLKSGQLVAIVGAVGAGKSCLLNLILGELKLFSGKLWINGEISYASQEPWLFAGSVRQNILFGKEYDAERYAETVKVCALRRDFMLFPYGDKTIVGERGASLSGGQRARINLARAVYKEADIYLFDDPLSAVDIQVGQELFENCLIRHLADKLIILVTHQLQYLKRADKLIILNEGSIQVQGSYEEIRRSGVSFAALLEEAASVAVGLPETEKETEKVLKAISHTSAAFNSAIDIEGFKTGPKAVAEMRTSGSVSASNYKEYFRAGGNCCVITVMWLLFIGAQLFGSGGDYFLSTWVALEDLRAHKGDAEEMGWWNSFGRSDCIYVYTVLITAGTVVAVARSLYFFSVCMMASFRLHNRMFQSIILAAMKFFHENSSGRILNRFSKDLGQVDEMLPNAFLDTIQLMLNLVGAIIIICVSSYWLVIPVCLMIVLFYFLRRFYLRTSTSIKRLEGIARSPVFAHLNATLQGIKTIRINNAEHLLVAEFDHLQDLHSSAWFMFIYTSRAFSQWLDWITALFIGCVTYICVINSENFYGSTVGLIITQSIGLTGLIQWGMRQSAELENQMTSVERVLEFTKVEQEPDLYSVGIVGRTGAGKSSLIVALFRLAYYEGEIYIDHLDISVLGLHDLRRKISIIPQEPILFHGTLRYNLDPFSEYTDEEILSALIDVDDKDAISKGVAVLDKPMTGGGQNISVGQRQMICLARAILRNNKILVMDEATANVDAQTDKLIQKTIRTKFEHCTVLTIAHRLHTVMDSDKILVMDAGQAVEFDHPHVLLKNPKGYLSELVKKTGAGTAAHLKNVAKQNFEELRKLHAIEEDNDSVMSYSLRSDSL
ncbi:probable multidrug resistance-associated protein lethal(2)03659 isoform X2 [Anthonomus grandis grandis]|uniref:probable multidrug resistance-associated protein lethal(2)03659 isoform X2 n=1 Tax=Anthonomus grandis grandis TaxID=2921223 RepID=UPI002166201E|nr:probable multidrug resistance-associated protein lethal(2)03659 isoform X2 [Anthonomus grandis grandis]